MKRFLFLIVCVALHTSLLSASSSTSASSSALITSKGTISSFPYKKGGVQIEKLETVTSVPNMPGLEIIETRFVNHGRPVKVLAYELCRTELPTVLDTVWSLQPSSSEERLDWVLPVYQGFEKQNYLGMNSSDYGGGIPVIDLWQPDGGVAIGLVEHALRLISMPVSWAKSEKVVRMCLRYDYEEPRTLASGEELVCYCAFRYHHTGDFFTTLRTFSEYMQQYEGVKMKPSEPAAFEPVWCAWGYERLFTIDEVVGTLDKVAELGFRWVDIDDGYQQAEGDWQTNERFPGGDSDMRRITDEVHRRGLKAKLWWAPLAADPGTRVLRDHPEMQLVQKDGKPEFITWWDSYYLSPVNPYTKRYSDDLVRLFMETWNFDGLKIDGQHLNCCMPDYNPASGLTHPEQAPEQMPSYFDGVYELAHSLKPEAVIQVCPCGCAVNYFLLPTINQAVASDPTSSAQVRMKRKAYAAMAPQIAYYGDHVELTDGGVDFASQIGTGSVIGTKFTYPADNPHASESFLLTPEKEQLIRHWMKIFTAEDLVHGQYLNLYTWGYDLPETHVIEREGIMYYAFYADCYTGTLQLRGLQPSHRYRVTEYTTDEQRSYEIDGASPLLNVSFRQNYLIRVEPIANEN